MVGLKTKKFVQLLIEEKGYDKAVDMAQYRLKVSHGIIEETWWREVIMLLASEKPRVG